MSIGDYDEYKPARPSWIRSAAEVVAAGAIALAGVAAFLVVFLLVNGGITYRIDCATGDGGVERHWKYELYQPIPYLLAPTRSGCEVHSATRVLASAVGIARLHKHSGVEIAARSATGVEDAYAAGLYKINTGLSKALRDGSAVEWSAAVQTGDETLSTLEAPDYVLAIDRRLRKAFTGMKNSSTNLAIPPSARWEQVQVQIAAWDSALADLKKAWQAHLVEQ